LSSLLSGVKLPGLLDSVKIRAIFGVRLENEKLIKSKST